MIPTLSQVCSLPSEFAVDIEDYAAGKVTSIELWFTKLEDFLKNHTTDDVKSLLAQHKVQAKVASIQGGLLVSQGPARQEAWELYRRRLQLCRELEIDTIVVAADIVGAVRQEDIERVQVSLRQLATETGIAGCRAAIEFQARNSFANNLQTAVALVDEVGSPHLGICLDAFQFQMGPSKLADLALLSKRNLFHVQLCDVADTPREFANDSDRILPGEGDFDLDAMISALRAIGYHGTVAVELMNPQIWQVPARQFGEIAITALRKQLGLATQ